MLKFLLPTVTLLKELQISEEVNSSITTINILVFYFGYYTSANCTIQNCKFYQNQAYMGGGTLNQF